MQSENLKKRYPVDLSRIVIRPLCGNEHERFNALLSKHHYLGCPAFIGKTIKYVALYGNKWVALLSFSSAALSTEARDKWIGWQSTFRIERLYLVANNTRFLILPKFAQKNLASKILSSCTKRLSKDWLQKFNHPLLMLETFVDPSRFLGTSYLAAGWVKLGMTKGFRKSNKRYIQHGQPKWVFAKPLHSKSNQILRYPMLCEPYRRGV